MAEFEYGWRMGKLVLEETKLTEKERNLLPDLTRVAFREVAERTRIGSGDDGAYVEAAYNEMELKGQYKTLVEVVVKLLKQRDMLKIEKHEAAKDEIV